MKYSELLADRIRRLCRERGITVNRLATLSGLRQSTIDNIIRGVSRNPQIKTLHRIAAAFEMTLAEFLDFEEMNEYSLDNDED